MDIQKQILSKLTKANGLRFSVLKPAAIESDKFTYHLKQLLKKRYIIKNRERYFLTKLGKILVAELVPIDAWGQSENVFKVNSLIFVLREHDKQTEILFKTRNRHPFWGFRTIPGGNINKGETSAAAASRHLLEKTGMSAKFTTFGTLRKLQRESVTGELILDIIFYLNWATELSGELDSVELEEHYWLPLTKALSYLDENPKLPHKISGVELRAILAAATTGKFYQREIEQQVPATSF